MSDDTQRRVFVMIDGDNTPLSILGDIEIYAQSLGKIVERRVYGLVASLSLWQQVHAYTKMSVEGGKNAADFVMSLDAVEIAAKDQVDIMVVCTNDGDFAYLVRKLSSMGVETHGVGTSQFSEALKKHMQGYKCIPYRTGLKKDIGEMLESLEKGDLSDASIHSDSKILGMMQDLLRHVGGSEGLRLSSAGAYMHSTYGVSKKSLPAKSWREFLAAHPDNFLLVGSGNETKVVLVEGDREVAGGVAWHHDMITEVEIDRLIRRLLRKHGQDCEMMAVELVSLMEENYGITAQSLPTRRWMTYLEGKPEQFEVLMVGPAVHVRLIVSELEHASSDVGDAPSEANSILTSEAPAVQGEVTWIEENIMELCDV